MDNSSRSGDDGARAELPSIKVVHVGDPLLGRGLRLRLRPEPGLEVVGETVEAAALSRLRDLSPDVVVVDTGLWERNGDDHVGARAPARR